MHKILVTTTQARWKCLGCSNQLVDGVEDTSPTMYNIIDFVTIASTGNAQDFGDLTVARKFHGCGSLASSLSGIFGGGDGTGAPQEKLML